MPSFMGGDHLNIGVGGVQRWDADGRGGLRGGSGGEAEPTDAPLFRLGIEPSQTNGQRTTSRLMVDKITMIPKPKLGTRSGRLADDDMVRLNRTKMVFLGLAG